MFEQIVGYLDQASHAITIRTILSWTTVLEMNGRWPWQRPPPDAAKLG
jgi:hypothetical protein